MKKKIIAVISAISLILSGCSSPQVNVIINADGYEGILLATENTVVPPVSIPAFVSSNYETVSGETDTSPNETTDITEVTPEITDNPVTVAPETVPHVITPLMPVEITTTTTTTTTTYIEITTPEPVVTTTTTTISAETEPTTTEAEEPPQTDLTPIMGQSVATVEQMRAFIKVYNPDVDPIIIDMIPYYLSEGEAEGVRGDIAFAQSCIETGYFKFKKTGTGSAVTLEDNNFCGLGVTELGKKGCTFETPQLGIRAQIQHLKAYGSTLPLNGEQVDPRFHYVKRGCAEYWEWLGIQENPEGRGWAGGYNYGPKILEIYYNVLTY